MPVPMWVARMNKRVFNPREIRRGMRPVLHHVGRASGQPHLTPLDANPVDSGYVFTVVYGPKSDWVRNVMAAGEATLEIEGTLVRLTAPRLIGREAVRQMEGVRLPPGILNVNEYLRMDRLG